MFDEDAGKSDDFRMAPTPTDGHRDYHRHQRSNLTPANRMACCLHVRAEPVAARLAEHAHALPRARTHPLDGRQQRPPVEHPELRALGELLGNRGGVPARPFVTESVSPGANNPCGLGRVRAHIPCEARHPARTPHVRGPLGAPSAVAVGEPAGDLRAGGPCDGRSRPGLGALLRTLQAARRLPLRHHRQHRRDRAFLRAFLRRAPPYRLGGGGGRVVRIPSRHKGAVVAVGN